MAFASSSKCTRSYPLGVGGLPTVRRMQTIPFSTSSAPLAPLYARALQLRCRAAAELSTSTFTKPKATICALVPANCVSPYRSATWQDVMEVMEDRISWEDEAFRVRLFVQEELSTPSALRDEFASYCGQSDMFVAVEMRSTTSKKLAEIACASSRPVTLFMESDKEIESMSRVNGLPVASLPPWLLSLIAYLPGPWGLAAKTWPILTDMWFRRSSDDLAFLLLLALNDFVTPVPSTQVKMGGDLSSLVCMCKNCLPEIRACMNDPTCSAALKALGECKLNDQVGSYRVITSYESALLENFSRCILQKHNCLQNSAEIPVTPNPAPMTVFRGQPLTHEVAEDILLGHLSSSGGQPFSWRVVCGKNTAFDRFPCQYQLYYRAKGVGNMWYDPIFKVETLDGRVVWRRRHYRVRRDSVPGTFYYSVLDNGVTSREFWRIMGCADDLSWSVFYYSGAASAAGMVYRGALLCTPTGSWPESADARAAIERALRDCGIRVWEMFEVNNCNCSDAPLSVPADANIAPMAILS